MVTIGDCYGRRAWSFYTIDKCRTPSHDKRRANRTPSAPSFSPYRRIPKVGSLVRAIAHSPIRLDLECHGGVLRLIERVAISAVFELVEDSVGQVSGLFS